jgi:uncharacterized protein
MPASKLIRILLALLAVTVLGGLAITLIELTDTALSVQERLEKLPVYLAYPLAFALAAIVCGVVYIVWKLLKPIRAPKLLDQQVSREALTRRVEQLSEQHAENSSGSIQTLIHDVQDEFAELDRRKASSEIYLALFGEISAGKSSLVAALTGADIPVDVRGGTTTQATLYRFSINEQLRLNISDVPGTNEANAAARAVIAREEALRAHVVALVVTGDLSRTEALEWQWLQAFGKPVWLILNKIDRYSPSELQQLQSRLTDKFGASPICVHASFNQEVNIIGDDGQESKQTRARAAMIDPLRQALVKLARQGAAHFEAARDKAVLQGLDLKLTHVEHAARRQQGEAMISQYTKRAMIGAMASVAPGSDVLIQGALAFGLVKSLTDLYGIQMRKVDIDDLLKLLSGKLKGSFAILLAIAGNAAKAFPGLGTLGGGAMHALAYALLFETVGRALLTCLDQQLLDSKGGVDRLQLLEKLDNELTDHRAMINRARATAKLLLAQTP